MANIRTRAAAEYLGLSKSTLDKFRCFGGGPAYAKLGRAVVYNTDDLDAWLKERQRTSSWGPANDNSAAHQAA
ncbi:helix-turn-helix transcriptional regulator [Pelagibacterium lentulum]|uniref:Helix-turn-helix domain-containing protein n=1 Tax=Pelagibacterium lentulum TaxID=2029865 RepID=A0A916VWP1_9HYPH|nr:helix-turn-helix domain-containing protein [Pelagibacterium lentulum]GGA47347.1 hypothetical protein GCM10011499_16430 [Pelagibacterium lentulum]